MPEFGGEYQAPTAGRPMTFVETDAITVASFSGGSAPVPAGELWVMTGFSLSVEAPTTGYLLGSGLGPLGANLGAGMVSENLPIEWWGSINWVGAVAAVAPQFFGFAMEASLTCLGMSAVMWGYALPYG